MILIILAERGDTYAGKTIDCSRYFTSSSSITHHIECTCNRWWIGYSPIAKPPILHARHFSNETAGCQLVKREMFIVRIIDRILGSIRCYCSWIMNRASGSILRQRIEKRNFLNFRNLKVVYTSKIYNIITLFII